MTTSSSSSRYKTPDGYTILEDSFGFKTGEKKTFLIRVPKDFDASRLDGLKLDLEKLHEGSILDGDYCTRIEKSGVNGSICLVGMDRDGKAIGGEPIVEQLVLYKRSYRQNGSQDDTNDSEPDYSWIKHSYAPKSQVSFVNDVKCPLLAGSIVPGTAQAKQLKTPVNGKKRKSEKESKSEKKYKEKSSKKSKH